MKLTLVILACLAIAGINAAGVHKNTSPADKAFLEKQKFLFEIVYRVEDPLQFEEWIKLGDKLIVEQTKYEKIEKYMTGFMKAVKVGGLLPKGEFFSETQKYQMLQSWGLFNFFYYAKDWETFVHNVCWARLNVNEGMFVYALNLAVAHRTDMQGLILPPIYEIFPQLFLNSKYVVHAEKFDSDVFNRQIMLEKELKTIYDQELNYVEEVYSNRFYLKDWKVWQWWKLMGVDEHFHQEKKTLLRNNISVFKTDPKYQSVMTDVKMYWTPVDYTRDVEIFNKNSKLSYFTEDLGWNSYWYYLNLDYAKFLPTKEFHMEKSRRGELWLYNVQQLLARYYMERLSQGMGEIDDLSFYGTIKTGYNPQLIAYNGNGFTYRKNYYHLESYQNIDMVNKITNLDRRIRDIIDTGKFVTKAGVTIDLTKPDAIEYVGDLMQGNLDILDKQFFGYWFTIALNVLSDTHTDDFTVVPHVMQNYETMLRDPICYRLFKRIIDVYYKFKYQFPAYTHEELIVPGVKIVNVEVSKLRTFFDLVDVDITNLMNEKMVFHDGKFVWDKTLLARQLRLNHKPFEYDIKVTSDKIQKVVVHTFLAPDFDEFGQKIDLFANRENFMELDDFVYELVAGENVIKRNSNDFYYTIHDQTTYTELYKYVMLAYEGKQELPEGISQPYCGFPDRLILPHGWVKGLPMKLFFIITPFTGTVEQFTTYGKTNICGSGVRQARTLPLGYPFDRKIDSIVDFLVPNMYVKDVKIYHTDKYEKYYPQKYEHFGTFDYTY